MFDAQEGVLERLRAGALPLPRNAGERQAWQDGANASFPLKHHGFELDLSDDRVIRVRLRQLQAFHMGGLGAAQVVNGITLAGMFDLGLGLAGTQQYPGRNSGTVDLSIKLMKPTLGPDIVLYAWATEKRTSVVFTEAEIHDSTGGRTVTGRGIVAVSATLKPALKNSGGVGALVGEL